MTRRRESSQRKAAANPQGRPLRRAADPRWRRLTRARRREIRRIRAQPGRLRTRDALALGLLHGPAELLPVSSSGHVALIPWLLHWPYAALDGDLRKAFEVALHAGTAAALLVGLRDEVGEAARRLNRRGAQVLVLSSLPPAIAGLAFERVIERRLGSPGSIAAGLVAGSVAMVLADSLACETRRHEDARAADGLVLDGRSLL